MASKKVAITINSELLDQVDHLVGQQVFPNRSKAIQAAIEEKLTRMKRQRLACECAKLDPKVEQQFAEEGMNRELSAWPEY